MEVIYLLIPLSLVLVAVIIACVVWAVRSGQFEDLDRPGYSIFDDDDDLPSAQTSAESAPTQKNKRNHQN